MSSKYKQLFLDHEADHQSLDESALLHPTYTNRAFRIALILNAVLLVVCLLLGGTPANKIIEYGYRQMIGNDTSFTGYPGPEWERSIHDVMAGTLIRVSDDELKSLGSDSIPLKDGGYAAGLGVAHNLHCVKQIKQFLYREHFFPKLEAKGEEFAYLQSHADYLRQSVMCHLDFTVYTLYWGEVSDKPTHREPGVQKCVNWDKLHAWMLGRQARTDMLMGP
ncbi:hypothetical protein F4801DRAFT_584092 [Xylaria longipes]|nr:hypothetical protein F4801DRAFT_584092 [Xylaria longipes]